MRELSLIILLISVILVAVFKHLDLRISEEIEEDSETDSEVPVAAQSTLPSLPNPTITQSSPPPSPANVTPVQPVASTAPDMPLPTITQVPSPTIQPQPIPAVATANPAVTEHTPLTSQPSPVVSQPSELEPESSQSDDEWGEMSGGWGDDSSTLVGQAEACTQQQQEIHRGEGPRDVEGHSLRPLPGTTPGQDGWYFDREGKPTHWRHEEASGWSQE